MNFSLAVENIATKPIYILGGLLMALSIALIVLVLFQSGKDKGLSGTIAGGAETFFGKSKGNTMDKWLSKATIAVSVVIVVLVISLVILITRGAAM